MELKRKKFLYILRQDEIIYFASKIWGAVLNCLELYDKIARETIE